MNIYRLELGTNVQYKDFSSLYRQTQILINTKVYSALCDMRTATGERV